MKKLWDTIDRWGPGAVSILTFVAMIALSWIYSSRLSYQQGQIDALNQELTRRQLKENQDWQLVETYRLEVGSLKKSFNDRQCSTTKED